MLNACNKSKKTCNNVVRQRVSACTSPMTANCNKHSAPKQAPAVRPVAKVKATSFGKTFPQVTLDSSAAIGACRKIVAANPVRLRSSNASNMLLSAKLLRVRSPRFQYFALRTRFRLYLRRSVCYIHHPAMRTLCNEGAPTIHLGRSSRNHATLASLD